MKYRAVFFDLDGTVSDTLQNITNAVNYTMREFGRPEFPTRIVKPHLGWGVDHLMQALIPDITEDELQAIMRFYRPYYAAHTTDAVRPYEGILPMLAQLKQHGLLLAIISNKPDASVQPLMERDFKDLIAFAVGERPEVARKPAPDMLIAAAAQLGVALSECVYVGDTEVDIQTAANTGIDCICVTWGFRTREALRRAGAKQIVDTPQALLQSILLS